MSTGQHLYEAVVKGDESAVENLLKNATTGDVNFISVVTGESALLKASDQGCALIVKMLLRHPWIEVNIQDKYGRSALFWACRNGHTEIAKMLLANPGTRLDLQDQVGCTALAKAKENDHLHIVEMLLAYSTLNGVNWSAASTHLNNVTTITKKPATPNKVLGRELSRAIILGDEETVGKLLLRATVEDVNWRDENDRTALLLASHCGYKKIVEMLLAHRYINVNQQNENGESALIQASKDGDSEIVQMLLAHPNIDVYLRDKRGFNAVHWASKSCHSRVVQILTHHPRATRSSINKDINVKMSMSSYYESEADTTTSLSGISMLSESSCASPKNSPVMNSRFARYDVATPSRDASEATAHNYICVSSPSTTITTTEFVLTPAPPTSPPLSWLAVRLLESGLDARNVDDCDRKLVIQEGFVSESDFAEMQPSELDDAYLNNIGISGRGVQLKIKRLHKELYGQYSRASPPSPPLSPPPQVVSEDRPSQPKGEPTFSCRSIPIEDIQALDGATSSRLLRRGRFSSIITDVRGDYTKEFTCVIKCAGQEAVSATDSDGARSIQREFQELAHLKGTKTATGCIACYHRDPSAHYLVLEKYGQDIHTLLVPGFSLAPQLAEAIVTAVNALHMLGVVHRDIKPHNILYDFDDTHRYVVKLCDLDGAQKVGDVCAASSLGTKQYEAPEVYFASRAGEKVRAALSMDIFSLGIVLWQVLRRSRNPPMSVEQLQDCYSDQNQLFSCVALSESTSMYQPLLYSCVKLIPHERITSTALYQGVCNISVSKAHPAWYRAQQENEFLKEKVSDQLARFDKKLDTVLEAMKGCFKELGVKVVGMAEVLRREIQLGHEGHSRVLENMKEATQDTLKLLTDAQEATHISSAEHTGHILSCISELQRRMDHNLATIMSNDNTSSSNTEGFESLLRNACDKVRSQFTSLSSHLQEQVRQQSAAGADSARDRAEALEMNRALTASLQEALEGIASVQKGVHSLKQGQGKLGAQVGRVLQDNEKLCSLLEVMQVRFSREVVGMAEVLRKTIILGHEGMLVNMKDMKESTEFVLKRLFAAQEATHPSFAEHIEQILSCIHELQNQMDRNFSAGKNHDSTTSSNTEGFESLLRDVSSHLQEQVLQQSAAGIDNARDRAEALAINRALTASLQEALKGIASVQEKVLQIKEGQEQLGVQINRVLQDNKKLDRMLRTLIVGTHDIPTYAVILPVVDSSWLHKASPMRLVSNQYRLYFLCSHTHQIAPCGPKGEGYKITVTKQWVRDAAPVLMAALMVLKLAMLAGGVPLPIPDLSPLLDTPKVHAEFLNAALYLIQEQVNIPCDLKSQVSGVEKAISYLKQVEVEDVLKIQNQECLYLEDGTPKAYAIIKSILSTHKIDITLSSGLRRVEKSGSFAWVLDNDTVVKQYLSSP